jgi:hypothetical protein
METPTMYTREVHCGRPQCGKPASYKIAAPWSAGRFNELKSYGLACADHYREAFRDAQRRSKLHQMSPEETVGEIGIYRYEKGKLDRQLERLGGIEAAGHP